MSAIMLAEPTRELYALVRHWQDKHDKRNTELVKALVDVTHAILNPAT
jgi:hypothetical protein